MTDKTSKPASPESATADRAELLKRALLEIETLDAKLAAAEKVRNEPIAIVGMACRFPAGANNPELYWQLLEEGRDGITEVSPDRWSVEEWYDPDPDAVGKAYTMMGGFIDDVDQFDAAFFGVSPREAEQMDPQQRWLLQVTWEALEDAGLSPDRLVGSQTGVFVGMTGSDFLHLQTGNDPGNIDTYVASGNSHAVAAGRLSYVLGLRGPAITIDTACSSALLSVHLACSSLRLGECDTAVAGGVLLLLSPGAYVTACKARLLSPDGHCKTFDDAADGYVRAEGCAMVSLKRLSDALADGDNVLAVIRGSACNQDGRSGGLTVPSGTAQEAVIRQALENAGVDPWEVSYVESHGTGTALGDPIEVQALDNVYSEQRSADHPLVIGSVKSNIGHTEALAGVAGLIKLVLSLERGRIPGDLHFHRPNTHIPWSELSVTVADEMLEWPAWSERRIGGLSSFGFSGTNVHMLVEQAPEAKQPDPQVDRPMHLLTVSARREAALDQLAAQYAERFAALDDGDVADVCHTAATGRSHFEYRAAVRGRTASELVDGLGKLASGEHPGVFRSGKIPPHTLFNVGFVFPGEGAQYVGMGRALYESQPTVRDVLDRCDQLLADRLDASLLGVLYPDDEPAGKALLADPRYAQPALFALQWALVELWASFGVTPTVVAGHGCGEIAAAAAAGIIDFEQGLILAAERGRLLSECGNTGAMAAIGAGQDEVRAAVEEVGGVEVAAVNAADSVVVSGDPGAVDALCERFTGEGADVRRIEVGLPLHTSRMSATAAALASAAEPVAHGMAHVDFVSMVAGRVATGPEAPSADYWGRQIQSELKVFDALRSIRAHDCRALVEIGPDSHLLSLVRRALPSPAMKWLPSLSADQDDWEQLLDSLATLYVDGMDVDWPGYDRDYARRKIALPTYPFEPETYTVKELAPRRQIEDTGTYLHPLVGRSFRSPRVADRIWEARLDSEDTALGNYVYQDCALVPAAAFLEAMLAAAGEVSSEQRLALTDYRHGNVLVREDGALVQVVVSGDPSTGASVEIFGLDADGPSEAWSTHAEASITVVADDAVTEATAEDRAEWEQRCSEKMRGAEFYEMLTDHGVSAEPEYRLIESVQRRPGEIVGQIRLPIATRTDGEAAGPPPGLIHALSQLLQMALPGMAAFRPGAPLAVLQSADRLWLADELPDVLYAHGEIAGDGVAGSGDLDLFDAEGRQVGGLAGAVHGFIDPDTLPAAHRERLKKWLYTIDWEEKTLATTATGPQRHWLVFADTVGCAAGAAAELRTGGERVSTVVAGASFADTGGGGYTANPRAPEDLKAVIETALGESADAELALVYCWSLDVDPPAADDSEPASAIADACSTVLDIARAAVSIDAPARISLTLVTQGAQPVAVEAGQVALAQTPFVGLQRVLGSEHPELGARIIDLDPGTPAADDPAMLAAELVRGSDDEDRQIAWRAGQRFVPRLSRCAGDAEDEAPVAPDVAGGAFLITGGLGGIGLSIADWLVARGAGHLFLMGRSGASEKAQARIDDFEERGAAVTVLSADVGDAAQLEAAFSAIDASGVRLSGVFHAAGLIDDAMLLNQDRARVENVMRPKVNGTWLLHSLTADRELDHFVLFSAAAALFGNPGQSNYAAANLFLDGLAHYRRSLGQPALSINWGAWGQVGMAAALESQTHERWAQMGVGEIDPADGAEVLGLAMLEDVAQLGIMPINWNQWRRAFPGSQPPPFANRLVRAGGEVAAGGPSIAGLLARLESGDAERGIYLGEYVTHQLAGLLGLGADAIDANQPVSDMGFDSLMATTLKTQILTDLGIDVPVAAILDGPSAIDLADRLLAVFDAAQAGTAAPEFAPAGGDQAADGGDWEEGAL